jgi:hypothetical protein
MYPGTFLLGSSIPRIWMPCPSQIIPDRCVPTLYRNQVVDNHNSYSQKHGFAWVPHSSDHLTRKWTSSSNPGPLLQSRPSLSRHNIRPPPPPTQGRVISFRDALSGGLQIHWIGNPRHIDQQHIVTSPLGRMGFD